MRREPNGARFGDRIWAFTREEAVAAGLFGTVRPEVTGRLGDVMVAARDALAFYDTRRVRPTAMEVVGQHGSLTKAEREVPLLSFQASGKAAPARTGSGKAGSRRGSRG